ncbi:MAG: rhomboid family intramembrane serine protease [Lachnospiraceae bacterium]|nr:rhomboid family intramembrane serine protease [Lachnospiraceae bacterium]
MVEKLTPANLVFIVINVVVFFIMTIAGSTEDVGFMMDHGAMFVPAVVMGREYYRFFTCMFLHFGFMHLMGNMVTLLFLGDNVERAVGWLKYVIIYLGGGLIGSLGSFGFAMVYNRGIVSAGASGAIFAIIGALLWIVICNRGRLEEMTIQKVFILIVYSLYSGARSENVDMAAHLCGLAGGFLVAVLVYRRSDAEDYYYEL